jgi:hypothetical protein
MTLRFANTSAIYMTGDVTSYSSTTLIANVTAIVGAGTLASWNISMAAVGAATAAGVSNTPAGNIAATNVQSAINELDTEKASSAAGAITDTNLNSIITAGSAGSLDKIPVITYTAKGRISAASLVDKITIGTLSTTTGGTSIDFTGIPATAKRITVTITGLSTSGTSIPIIQLGDSGGIEVSGYTQVAAQGTAAFNTGTTGFALQSAVSAAMVLTATYVFDLSDSATFTWSGRGTAFETATPRSVTCSGTKSLSATLDRIRLTTINGTDTIDANAGVNISYE